MTGIAGTINGHELVSASAPEPLAGPEGGPASPWPAAAESGDIPAPLPLTPTAPWWRTRWQADGDTVITRAMTAVVAAVILFAAIVSYSHVHALAAAHREDWTQLHLLPLSLDGVIAEASLVLLFAARHKLAAPRLARVMLWTGIAATLGANALVALPAQWVDPVADAVIGAALSAWPAAAFVGSVELVMQLVRDVRAVRAGDTAGGSGGDMAGDSKDDTRGDSDRDTGKPRRRASASAARDKVAAMIKLHSDWDNDRIAKACGVDVRTVQRRRKALASAEVTPGVNR